MKGSRALVLAVLLATAWAPGRSSAHPRGQDTSREHFGEANALFRQANALAAKDPGAARRAYAEAAMHFESVVREGGIRNGRLYYNLGNTYFRLGDLGRAVLNYRRAAELLPGDPDVAANLEFVRTRRTDRIEEPDRQQVLKTLLFWHYDLSLRWKKGLFLASFTLFWLLASVQLFVRNGSLKWALTVAGAAAALFFGSLAADQAALLTNRAGVIVSEQTTARKGDGETYEPSFQEPLHAGTEFVLLEKRPGWWEIRLSDGRSCWIPEGSAELVRQTS